MTRARAVASVGDDVDARAAKAVRWLERRGSRRNREGMARFGIVAPKIFGVSIEDIRALAKRLGHDHELALALWKTGWQEARILCAFVDDPALVTPRQMDQWARDFDNWAVCDALCFHLFDRTPHIWTKARQWSMRRGEFVRRAAFAMIAGRAVHAKKDPDALFTACLPLVDAAAGDDRNFVKKAVSWALRTIGKRSMPLNVQAVAVAERLTRYPEPSARWIGRDALRELAGDKVLRRLEGGGLPRR